MKQGDRGGGMESKWSISRRSGIREERKVGGKVKREEKEGNVKETLLPQSFSSLLF